MATSDKQVRQPQVPEQQEIPGTAPEQQQAEAVETSRQKQPEQEQLEAKHGAASEKQVSQPQVPEQQEIPGTAPEQQQAEADAPQADVPQADTPQQKQPEQEQHEGKAAEEEGQPQEDTDPTYEWRKGISKEQEETLDSLSGWDRQPGYFAIEMPRDLKPLKVYDEVSWK